MLSRAHSRAVTLVTALVGARGSLRAEISHGVAGSMVLTAVNLVLRLATGVLLARVLGANGYGAYSFAIALVALLQIPTQLGLPQLITREVAALREKNQWGMLRGLISRANQGVGFLGVITALVALGVGLALLGGGDSPRMWCFLAGLPLLPIVALSSLRQATLRGLRHVVLGQMPELLFQPALVVLALVTGYVIAGARFVSPAGAVWLNVGAALVAFVAGSWLLLRRIPDDVRTCAPEYRSRLWLRQAVPFMLLAGLSVVNSRLTIVMVGIYRPDADVGVYQVCLTASVPVAFGLTAANAVVAPHVSRLWARQEMLAMQRLVTGTARVALAVALVVTAVIVPFGGVLLAFFFGEEFRQGATALILIAVGQLMNAAFGSVGVILNMTGHTRLALRGFAVAVTVNLIMNLILIPHMGIEGAALGALASFFAWNSILFFYVRSRVGVFSLAFGGRRWGPRDTTADPVQNGEDRLP